jgi:hypothetical protein
MNKVFTKGEVLKAVPDKLFKSKCDLYGFASVEVPDREGDIIRVKGISLEYHRSDSPIKVAVQHNYKPLPDGTMPVLGTVSEWAITTKSVGSKSVPALAFGMNYAQVDGEITPFAAKYKGLYDTGALDAFSVGLEGREATPIKGGGLDVLKSAVFEVSSCMIGMNPYATVIKALTDAVGDDFDKFAYLESRILDLQKSTDRVCGLHESLLKAFTERFDTFESKYVAQADSEPLPRDQRTAQLDPSDLLKALNSTLAKLK